jgi:hypothetical protein
VSSSGDFFQGSRLVFKKSKMAGFFELLIGRCSLKKFTGVEDVQMQRVPPLGFFIFKNP